MSTCDEDGIVPRWCLEIHLQAVLIGKNQLPDLFDVLSIAPPYPKLPQDVGPQLILDVNLIMKVDHSDGQGFQSRV